MSWSLACTGKTEDVAKEIEAKSENLSGVSKEEFDEAKPHLIALVRLNFSPEGVGSGAIVDLEAFGHGHFEDGKQVYGQCSVTIKQRFGPR